MKTLVLSLLTTAFFISCSTDSNSAYTQQDVAFTTVAKGDDFNYPIEPFIQIEDQGGYYSFTTAEQWQQFINSLPDYFLELSGLHQYANIDFSTKQVVVMVDQTRRPRPFSLNVNQIVESADFIKVKYEIKSINQILALTTRPYQIIEIPKTNKIVYFQGDILHN